MSARQPRWGMVADLNRCVGCQTCTIACKHTNDTLPGVQWRRVIDVETGTFPDVERLFLVTGCQHCANPPCVPVCPSGATRQRADGLVTMDYDRCIGCGYCAVACPYQARTIAHDQGWYYGQPTAQEEAVSHPDRLGVAQKCSFCVERIDQAATDGRTPGDDLEVTPACAASCIADALVFGDFNNPQSRVSGLIRDNQSFQMHAELGTDPQIRYLYQSPENEGRPPGDDEMDEERLGDTENPLVGTRQRFWDMRAAMNFTLGGMGSGLAMAALSAHLLQAFDDRVLAVLLTVAGALMAGGLFFVFLEIGRKRRFLYVFLRPQSSWMSREAWVVGAFYPAIAANFLWPGAGLRLTIGLLAAAFLYCQARILPAARGISAWRAPVMSTLLVVSGLSEGLGLLGLAAWAFPLPVTVGPGLAAGGLLFAVANAGLWYFYRRMAALWGVVPLARRTIERLSPALHVGQHILPALFYTAALGIDWGSPIGMAFTGAAGAFAVTGGALWKIVIITRASWQQGFALGGLPRRGSGKMAAPSAMDDAA